MPIKIKANNGNIDLKAPIKQTGGAVNSVNGMTGDVVLDIPSKTSDLVNDSGFIAEIPSEYVTETELESKGYLTEHQSLAEYAKKSDIPDVSGFATKDDISSVESKIPSLEGYATEQWVEAKGYLTAHQSLENYALKSEIPTKTSDLTNDSGYLTEHQSLAAYALKSEIPTVPTNVSALTNDSGYLTLATLPKYDGGVE